MGLLLRQQFLQKLAIQGDSAGGPETVGDLRRRSRRPCRRDARSSVSKWSLPLRLALQRRQRRLVPAACFGAALRWWRPPTPRILAALSVI